MVICICSFTKTGNLLLEKIKSACSDYIFIEKEDERQTGDWVRWCFEQHLPVVFVGAVGIAVRFIAPFVENKLTDSPVIVVDELGKYVVPVLSGHVGGANKIAEKIAANLNAIPVITTATDLESRFSVDVFAVNNGLKIHNKDGIKLVSRKILDDEKIKFWISPEIKLPEETIPSQIEIAAESSKKADVCIYSDENKSDLPESLLYLSPKKICLGMGCKKGKTFAQLNEALKSVVSLEQLENINSLSSISIKKEELGLQMLAQFYHWLFKTYEAEDLEKAALNSDEKFSESDFVKEITGVSNVCERSAVCSAGENASLIMKKNCVDGVTIALAEQIPIIKTWSAK